MYVLSWSIKTTLDYTKKTEKDEKGKNKNGIDAILFIEFGFRSGISSTCSSSFVHIHSEGF